ncbi:MULTISPECIES: (2Fe-2S)-binding protein [unclassified Rhizobium]|jgi:carbon-monoxide dehydrogenase small subunit|uniref:(2Fe-2S)-binding protein n=1 Tax=unclassified Rhizobium TaxID=2613769 RepID=UPI00064793DF|nr:MULTISPECIES: (2Fe-2S)-binding protein [unclassified Rhizobium]OJY60909.1 MAG: (2Fe-2S)-binding protein [Rhizobium sp. 60-20]RKD35560.1 carbon-monoxide dehydrogenase small subunit [Rhizobium sp. WW_1]
MSILINVNGEERVFDGEVVTPLLDVLRNTLFLTGAKDVCREGFCGACMVHVDGVAMASCLIPIGLARDKRIVTIEGLGRDDHLSPLQQALEDLDAVQCGMCFPGMVMSLTKFLEEKPAATRNEIKRSLTGNVCRCTGYERIIDAALALCQEQGSKS